MFSEGHNVNLKGRYRGMLLFILIGLVVNVGRCLLDLVLIVATDVFAFGLAPFNPMSTCATFK